MSTSWPAILLGGALGALVRLALLRGLVAVELALHARRRPLEPAWATLTANTLGCALLGGVLALAARGALPDAEGFETFATVGVCGSLSTFSTLAADAIRLAAQGGPQRAISYLAATVVLGAAAFGLAARAFG